MRSGRFKPGDWVVYTATKYSSHPGPRARDIDPTPMGEDYVYEVDKFWVVAEVLNDGQLRLRTRRGKEHVLAADSPRIRRPSLWERFRYRSRFPQPAAEC